MNYIRLAALITLACFANAQTRRTYTITTAAGTVPPQDNAPATTAIFDGPHAVEVGPDGVVYVSDVASGLRSIDSEGVIHRIPLGLAADIAVDTNNVLYWITAGPQYYQRLPNGTVKTVWTQDTQPVRMLSSLAIDSNNNLVAVDWLQDRILRINSAGVVIETVAGQGSHIPLLGAPLCITASRSGSIYFADAGSGGQIVEITSTGESRVIAGSGKWGIPVAGRATDSPLQFPEAIAVTDKGVIYASDSWSRVVIRIDTEGLLTIVLRDLSALDLAVDPSGRLLVYDRVGKLWRLNADGAVELLAGIDQFAGDGGPATSALLKQPRAVALDSDGSLIIGDTGNNRIRKVSPEGVITTLAGNGDEAQIAGPDIIVSDEAGGFYFAARSSVQVHRLTKDGRIETVMGNGTGGDSGDGGPAIAAQVRSVWGLAVGVDGSLFISDGDSNRVRVVRPDGIISTYAGTGQEGLGQAVGLAAETPLNRPGPLVVDRNGDLIVAERDRLRRVSGGKISTLASAARLGTPHDTYAANICDFIEASALAFDIDGSLLISANSGVCRLDKDGVSWGVAGQPGVSSFRGDGGPATSAALYGAAGIAVTKSGTIYIADSINHRVRRLDPTEVDIPQISSGGVVGAGGSLPTVTRISPGGFASVFGKGFSRIPVGVSVQQSDFVNGRLPTNLATTCVEVNSQRAYITYVDSGQINFLVPAIQLSWMANFRVIANCGTASESSSAAVSVATAAMTPEFLYWAGNTDGRNPVTAVNAITGAYVGAPGLIPGLTFAPAKPGDLLTIYCISLGQTIPSLPDGQAAAVAAPITGAFTISIGGTTLTPANVLYAGLSPGTAGLYQINIRVPALPDGDHPIVFRSADFSTPAGGFITVRNQD